MNSYNTFVFRSYTFNVDTKTLSLTYGYDESITFIETYVFDFDFIEYSAEALDTAFQHLFFIAGVSYYKAYLAPGIRVDQGQIDLQLATFLSDTYQKGLGEFFYVNHLDPRASINFPINQQQIRNMVSVTSDGCLVGLGGGKDSLVSVELLRNNQDVTTWSLGHGTQLQPLVERVGLPHFAVRRNWDKKLLELNKNGAYNGHVPISAILACVGIVVAILSGKRDVVVSNEHSANEPTLSYNGVAINHQYSKSEEFEADYQRLLRSTFGDTIRYYSLLRPFSEIRISELFANHFSTYKDVFSSCNRAFVHSSDQMSWCGECPKCAFVFLAFTPFINGTELERLFGKNLLTDKSLVNTYRQLLGIEGDKPLECVGEIQESRSAMQAAFIQYPELRSLYIFDLPDDYDYRAMYGHLIPSDATAALDSIA